MHDEHGRSASADAVRRLRTSQPHARLYLMYGLTEAFRRTAYLDPAKVDEKPGSIGGAIPGAEPSSSARTAPSANRARSVSWSTAARPSRSATGTIRC